MSNDEPLFPSSERTQRLIDLVAERRKALGADISFLAPWRRPCVVKALLVTDGGLSFDQGDFGLSTFVDILLNDQRSYVRFDLTVAHLRPGVTDTEVMAGAPGITRSIKGFVFDDPNHFTPTSFDEVWLFGIERNFHNGGYPNREADLGRYPATSLGDAELAALTAHMNTGHGGIFATGDHGPLGKALCAKIDRIRNMRYWDDFLGPTNENEVDMTGRRRNDSNQRGHDPGSQFSDQSDDIPQPVDLKLYTTRVNALRQARYPHPVLCSALGRIDVFPDHPHEGECREPDDLTLACTDGTREYPNDSAGVQVRPELVAWGRTVAGNDALVGGFPSKDPTQGHVFGLVSTYDGHRANVGRVVCDSTWHHFVNVNLIGILEGGGFDDFATPGTHPSKHIGFLASPEGRAALAKIREYYVNVGVWIATPDQHSCMRFRSWWDVIWHDRVVEAALTNPSQRWDSLSLHGLLHIGIHARDVLGRAAGPCQTLEWILPILDRLWPELRQFVVPWDPWPDEPEPIDPPPPWLDLDPVVTIMLGGATAALHDAFPYPPEDLDEADRAVERLVVRGARFGLQAARERLAADLEQVSSLLGDRGRVEDDELDES